MRLEKNLEKESDIKSNIKYVTNKQREQEWIKENKEAINGQNERITKYGCFSDGYRRF